MRTRGCSVRSRALGSTSAWAYRTAWVPRISTDPSAAASWVRANLLLHVPATSIIAVTVGNEVLSGTDAAMLRSLLPAMESLHAALAAQVTATAMPAPCPRRDGWSAGMADSAACRTRVARQQSVE